MRLVAFPAGRCLSVLVAASLAPLPQGTRLPFAVRARLRHAPPVAVVAEPASSGQSAGHA